MYLMYLVCTLCIADIIPLLLNILAVISSLENFCQVEAEIYSHTYLVHFPDFYDQMLPFASYDCLSCVMALIVIS